jgi:flavodoxin
MKTLIVFYSFEWSTKYVAENLKDILWADILEIETEKELANKWSFLKYFWLWKMVIMKEEVELKEFNQDFLYYDLIILWTPVWSFSFTPPIRTFLAKKLLKNKKIALYCCHEWWPWKTLANMEKELEWNEIVSKNDFLNPFKKDKEKTTEKILEWGEELKNIM